MSGYQGRAEVGAVEIGERDRHRFLMRSALRQRATRPWGARMALYRAVESRPVMAARMMTRECVGRKSI
jgi:hypothetical protein